MDTQLGNTENLRRKLSWAVRHINANVGAFTPSELEKIVGEKLVDAATIPTEPRTNYARYKLGLTK
ncbi:MAG: hypothetical protein JRN17_03500 [Nitrososphaerota archaeon]|nr:hypothetical protein [Nitrososphaerota archaeon]